MIRSESVPSLASGRTANAEAIADTVAGHTLFPAGNSGFRTGEIEPNRSEVQRSVSANFLRSDPESSEIQGDTTRSRTDASAPSRWHTFQ